MRTLTAVCFLPCSFVKRGSSVVDLAAILHVAVQVAQGLQHLHSSGICHSNLKCQNILLYMTGDSDNSDVAHGGKKQQEAASTAASTAAGAAAAGSCSAVQEQAAGSALQQRPCLGVPQQLLLQHAANSKHLAHGLTAKLSDYGVIRALIKARSHRTTKSLGEQHCGTAPWPACCSVQFRQHIHPSSGNQLLACCHSGPQRATLCM
jgi:serine/threonine protein kinase